MRFPRYAVVVLITFLSIWVFAQQSPSNDSPKPESEAKPASDAATMKPADIPGLDPKTGNVIEYPYVHAENMMKEFFLDKQGHMWYGSAPNNKVGYFYLTEPTEHAAN